ncbi:MAG: CaiB/BaiF CoA transferase family protein [Smithellaceae bacterium]
MNLKNPAGREVFLKLAEKVDVILESFRPGVTKKLGVDYDAVRKVNERIIYCSISSFGQNGPMRIVPSHDLNTAGMTGIQHVTELINGIPALPALQVADTAVGTLAAVAILSALWQRTIKNKGQYLDVSMYESCFSWQHYHICKLLDGLKYDYTNDPYICGPSYNLYPTADGKYISVASLEPHFWAGLCKLLGKEHLLEKRLAVGEEGEQTKKELKEVFLTRTQDEWMNLLGPAGICVAPVLPLPEALEHPQAKFRNVLVSGGPNAPDLRQLNCPIKGDDLDEPLAASGPKLGEHNIEVLLEIGMNKDQIKSLSDAGAFGG